jgi:deoxyhypusine synthase
MAKTQSKQVSDDTVVQFNLEELYQAAHTHDVRTTVPGTNDGSIGDIVLVESGGTKLYVKFRSGWKSVTLS